MTAGYLPAAPDTSPEANSRYTTPALLAWCREQARVEAFDLDVAACEEAHHAPRWYSREDDGLRQPWSGRVWCNPPWDDLRPWVERAWSELARGECHIIAMLLPGNRQEQPWWQDLVEPVRDAADIARPRPMHLSGATLTTHYPPKRQPFGRPGNPTGIGIAGVPHPVVLLIWRRT